MNHHSSRPRTPHPPDLPHLISLNPPSLRSTQLLHHTHSLALALPIFSPDSTRPLHFRSSSQALPLLPTSAHISPATLHSLSRLYALPLLELQHKSTTSVSILAHLWSPCPCQRSSSEKHAISELVSMIPPEAFQAEFGAPVSDLASLVAAKSVTINQVRVCVCACLNDAPPP